MRTCLVIVPTYNERENLPLLVRELMSIPGVRALVIDDSSPDGTGEAADLLALEFPGRVEVVHRARKNGFGSACVEGIRRALDGDSDVIAQIDGDLSHEVRYLPALIAATVRADLAIGSRYVSGGGSAGCPVARRVLSRAGNLYVRGVTGVPVRDCTAGYRCWRRTALMQLPIADLTSSGYGIQVETTWQAFRRGLRIAEVPVVMASRRHGVSKFSWSILLEALVLPWRLRRQA